MKYKTYSSLLDRLMLFPAVLLLLGISSSSEAVTIKSNARFTKAPNAPLAGTLQFTTDVPSRVSVSVKGGAETWERDFYDYSTTHSIPLFGFKPGRNNEITVTVRDRFQNEFTAPAPVIFKTDLLPNDFPNITLQQADPAKMEPGYTLFRTDDGYVIFVDSSGEVVWYGKTPSTLDVRQLENGNLFMPSSDSFVELDLLGNTIKSWVVATNLPIDWHDGVPTDHGSILYLSDAVETVTDYLTHVLDPNSPLTTVNLGYEKVVEISTTNAALLNIWEPIKVLDPRRISYLVAEVGPGDSEHSNGVIEDPSDDSLIVSMRHQNAVVKFSRATGQLKWILGPPEGWSSEWQPYLLTPVGAPFTWQYGQHAPIITPQGTLLLYDDGNYRAMPLAPIVSDADNYSRAVEYKVDEQKMQISQVWDYGRTNMTDRLYTAFEGNADPLPITGNVLIDFSAVSYVNGVPPSPANPTATMVRIQEVTHDSVAQVVFDLAITMYDKTNSVKKNCSAYRSHRVPDLYGHPSLAVTDLNVAFDEGVFNLEFSGDPVRTYAIEASSDLKHWTEIGVSEFDEEGVYNFVDADSENPLIRYYRVVTH